MWVYLTISQLFFLFNLFFEVETTEAQGDAKVIFPLNNLIVLTDHIISLYHVNIEKNYKMHNAIIV